MLKKIVWFGDIVRYLGSVTVLGYAGLLILVSIVPPVAGQVEGRGDLERRVAILESMNVDRRLTVLETIQEAEKEAAWWHKGSGVGVGLLLGERALLVLKKRGRGE